MPSPKATGRAAVHSFRRGVARKVVDMLRERDMLDGFMDAGLVSREFVENPHGDTPFSDTAPLEMVERMLERSIERKPSLIAGLGLSTIQLLANKGEEEEGAAGTTARLTIAFTDLEGFTRFTERRGDEEASHLLVEHHRTVGPIVRSRGGRVVKRLGDGLMLSFPSSEAAVLAAIELLPAAPEELRLRAGVHCGEVMTTRDDVIGHVVNVAARVAEAAKGDEVLVTTVVRDEARELPDVEFTRARRRNFKGVGEPISVCRARSLRD